MTWLLNQVVVSHIVPAHGLCPLVSLPVFCLRQGKSPT